MAGASPSPFGRLTCSLGQLLCPVTDEICILICKYDVQMHMKMQFPIGGGGGWSHATLTLKVYRSEFCDEILHKL